MAKRKEQREIYNNFVQLKKPTDSYSDLVRYYNAGKISKHTFERIIKIYYSNVFELGEGLFLSSQILSR